MAVALAGTFLTASVQAQGPERSTSAREQSQDSTVRGELDDLATLAVSMPADDLQQSNPQQSNSQQSNSKTDGKSSLPDAPTPNTNPADTNKPNDQPNDQYGKQPKRILGIIPNFRAVSANTKLPPLSFKEEFKLASQDTFDYSDVIFVGALAGISMAQKSQPSFGQGAAGYGRYYWHVFVDGAIENYMTEAIVPAATREDPRYYTLGKGGFFKRSGYAVSRLFITRTDSGKRTINLSEIVGAGAAAGIGNAYYPAESNPFVKTYQRWGTQVGLDGVFDVLKEFWPDIDHAVFHGKY